MSHMVHRAPASPALNSSFIMEAHRCPTLSSSPFCWSNRVSPNKLSISLQFPLRHKVAILSLRRALQPVAVVQEQSVDHLAAMKSIKKLISFVKYQGLGNDFLLIDNRDTLDPKVSQDEAVKICNRNFGVGADGVIFAMPAVNGSDYSMRIFNSDGSEPEMCGNGIRCMARFVAKLEGISQPRSYNIHTLAGSIIPKLQADGQVAVDMGPPILNSINIPTKIPPTRDGAVIKAPLLIGQTKWIVTCVSMGNPHCITFGQEGVENLDLNILKLPEIGPLFENHEAFPSRTNTEFVQVLSRSHLRMKVWERGAGATLACGTGACALLVAAVLEGRADRKCRVDLPGGPLEIEWKEENNHVYMTGPAEEVFIGTALV